MSSLSNFFHLIFTGLISTFVLCENSVAQTHYIQTEDSYLTISGTSTLHDWTMTSKEGKCQADFEIQADGIPAKLNSLSLSVRSESLKSGHNAMDKNTYSTLNSDAYKNITFKLITASIINTKIQCSGNLTVAGITKQITVEAMYKVLPNNSMLCSGTKILKMSDFEIEAPTFMFGTVITGDEITVSFKLTLAPAKE